MPLVECVQDGELFAFPFVADRGDREDLSLGLDRLLERLFDPSVRNHLAPDLRESRHPAGDLQEPVFAQVAEVTRDVPTLVESGLSQIIATKVTAHHVRSLDQHQPFGIGAERLVRLGLDDPHRDSG